jgi:hypothetical protein
LTDDPEIMVIPGERRGYKARWGLRCYMAELARYGEVKTMEFDTEQKERWTTEINKLLADGWEIIDASVGQWARPPHPVEKTAPPELRRWPAYCFILGKPRQKH